MRPICRCSYKHIALRNNQELCKELCKPLHEILPFFSLDKTNKQKINLTKNLNKSFLVYITWA